VLVVEDCDQLRQALCVALGQWLGAEIVGVSSVAACKEALARVVPDLVLLDVELSDGDAFDVAGLLAGLPSAPRVVVMSGVAGPDESFRLAQLGVRRYVAKPVDLPDLEKVIEEALHGVPDLTPHVRAAVGAVPMLDLEEQIRHTMLEEALARSGGNRRAAARMLNVSRQLLQHMLRKLSPSP
jgi:DNA-binding NtrC family response regulator